LVVDKMKTFKLGKKLTQGNFGLQQYHTYTVQ
jgi:hypothetical protein